jgi:hypothetical protein
VVLVLMIIKDRLITILLNNIITLNVFCSYLNFVNWLQNHLIPCPFKKLTGIDCPGCGMQRAIIALLKGDIYHSLSYYPACIAILITSLFVAFSKIFHFNKTQVIKKSLCFITVSIITVSYIIKLYNLLNY